MIGVFQAFLLSVHTLYTIKNHGIFGVIGVFQAFLLSVHTLYTIKNSAMQYDFFDFSFCILSLLFISCLHKLSGDRF